MHKAFTHPRSLPKGELKLPIKKNKVLLINPFYRKDPNSSFGKHVLTPSLALSSIAATTPSHWEVIFWDENLLQAMPVENELPEVVGITVHLTFAKRAYELAAWFREKGVIVVFGGLHVQACQSECSPHADILVVGEGVQVWNQVLSDIEHQCYQNIYSGDYKKKYSEEPSPKRDIIPKEQFLTRTSMIATRGCHNRCNFCYLSTEGMFMPYQTKHIQQVIDEIKEDNAKYVVFIDNNLGSRPAYLRELCEALQELKIIWSAAVSIDVTDDPSLVLAMAKAGCTGVFVGFESLNSDSIIHTGKKSPMPEDYARRVRVFHDVGIQINGSFVLGFDYDGPDVFEKTIKWIEDNKLESANFQILTPYPGTPLFDDMRNSNRIIHFDWEQYDTGNVVFKPKNMTATQLKEGYEKIYKRHNSLLSIWKRRPQNKASVIPYLLSAILYRKSNWFWYILIRFRLTNLVWEPLVEMNRLRHLRFRKTLDNGHSKVISIPPGV